MPSSFSGIIFSLALAASALADTTQTLSASYCSVSPVSTTGTGTATGVQYTSHCEPMVHVEKSGLSPGAIGAIVGIVVGVLILFAMIAWIFIARRRRVRREATPSVKPPMYEFATEGNALGYNAEKKLKWEDA
ncbi:hypothetical protein HDZ31DRAFT_61594 [Schizophyllum fasciatum]